MVTTSWNLKCLHWLFLKPNLSIKSLHCTIFSHIPFWKPNDQIVDLIVSGSYTLCIWPSMRFITLTAWPKATCAIFYTVNVASHILRRPCAAQQCQGTSQADCSHQESLAVFLMPLLPSFCLYLASPSIVQVIGQPSSMFSSAQTRHRFCHLQSGSLTDIQLKPNISSKM